MSDESLQPLRPARRSLSQQAQEYLLSLIDDGTYRPGDQLPSQQNLAAQLGISRPTLREALLNMEQEGAIVLRHGVGTFVAPGYGHRMDSGLERLESVVEMANRQGLRLGFAALRVREEPAGDDVASALQVPPGTPLISVCRVIVADERPVAYLLDWVLASRLSMPQIDEQFNGSVLDLLRQRSEPPPAWAVADIVAVNAMGDIADKLAVQEREAVLLLEEVLYDHQGIAAGISRNYFVPAHFRFHVIRR